MKFTFLHFYVELMGRKMGEDSIDMIHVGFQEQRVNQNVSAFYEESPRISFSTLTLRPWNTLGAQKSPYDITQYSKWPEVVLTAVFHSS